MAEIGHNSGIAADTLRSFIERIERLEEERKGYTDDIRSVYAEAKGSGFDTKVMRRIVRERKKEPTKRAEEEERFDLYAHALGIFG